MIRRVQKKDELIKLLLGLIEFKGNPMLDEFKFNQDFKVFMIDRTNDVYLSEGQFEAFKEFLEHIGESYFYLTHYMAIKDKFIDDYNEEKALFSSIYIVDKDVSYDDYMDIFIFEVSIMFSQSGKWILIIQEGYPYGEGKIALHQGVVDDFKNFLDVK